MFQQKKTGEAQFSVDKHKILEQETPIRGSLDSKNSSNLSNLLGLNKSDLYSPHINVLKNMTSKEPFNRSATTATTNKLLLNEPHDVSFSSKNDDFFNYDDDLTGGDPDLYDFSHVRPSLLLETSSNNPTDDEEDDINFDYGYGYDYERIIKDRLKQANSEFKNESTEPAKPKSTLVSFDNAVTAFDIPSETDTENGAVETTAPSKKADVSFSASSANDNNVSKLPLNDTVQKEDPDSFTNKLREAIMRYDTEQQMQLKLQMEQYEQLYQLQQQNYPQSFSSTNNNSGSKMSEPSAANTKQINNQQEPKQSKNIVNNNNGKQTLTFNGSKSPSPILNTQTSPDLTLIYNKTSPNNKPSSNHKVLHIVSNADESVDTSINDELNANQNRSNIDTNRLRVSSPPSQQPSSASSSFRNSPEPTHQTEKNNKTNFSFSASLLPKKIETNPLSGLTKPKDREEVEEKPSSKNEEKMLIEKDGVFELMSAEEYTAYEKKKALERKINNKNSGKKTTVNNNNNKPIIPHPPAKTRPSTSNDITKNRKASLKSRYIVNTGTNRLNTNNTNSTNSSVNNSNDKQGLIRMSHSADNLSRNNNRNKSFSPINNHRTPDYAQNYKSPYQLTNKIYKPIETNDARKEREEKEREEKRKMNEDAFKSWLKMKDEQRLNDQKRKHKVESDKKGSSNEISCTSSEEVKISFEEWCRRKREQIEKDKEMHRMEKLEQLDSEQKKISPEEKTKVFKEWLNRKLKEKNDALKQEKLENKKWNSRRRRSRKHQRLTQALELAQAYGYSSSYYAPGFNF